MSSPPQLPDLADRPHPTHSFDTLRELTRHGYVPDAQADEGQGILLRHEAGPDLMLRPDGSLALPAAQPIKRPQLAPERSTRRLSWGRTALIILFALAFWTFSLVVTIGLTAE